MADFRFIGYDVEDTAIALEFVNFDPGPGNETNYVIRFTDAELAAITTTVQLRNAVQAKLRRKLQREGIAAKLDPFLEMTVTI